MTVGGTPHKDLRGGLVIGDQFCHQVCSLNGKQLTALRSLLTVKSCNNDLPHDGRRRRHLRQNSLRQYAAQSRQPLLNRLSRGTNLHVPVELDVDHIQTGSRLTADGLNPAGS